MPETCGDYGGKTKSGTPCDRPAGWGVDGEDTGKCNQHRKDTKTEKTQASDTKTTNSNDERNVLDENKKLGCIALFLLLLLSGAIPYLIGFGIVLILFGPLLLIGLGILFLPFLMIWGLFR